MSHLFLVPLLLLFLSQAGSNRPNFGEAAANASGDSIDHVVEQASIVDVVLIIIMSPIIVRVVVVVVVVIVQHQVSVAHGAERAPDGAGLDGGQESIRRVAGVDGDYHRERPV